jgi:hypothetical protein
MSSLKVERWLFDVECFLRPYARLGQAWLQRRGRVPDKSGSSTCSCPRTNAKAVRCNAESGRLMGARARLGPYGQVKSHFLPEHRLVRRRPCEGGTLTPLPRPLILLRPQRSAPAGGGGELAGFGVGFGDDAAVLLAVALQDVEHVFAHFRSVEQLDRVWGES